MNDLRINYFLIMNWRVLAVLIMYFIKFKLKNWSNGRISGFWAT